jgi:hypothetical protein
LQCFGSGSDVPPGTLATPCLSIAVHGKGKNLQAWDQNLVLEPPSSGAKWEQLIGRTHRQGQSSKVVSLDVAVLSYHDTDKLKKAREEADYIATMTGQDQRLQIATWVGWPW